MWLGTEHTEKCRKTCRLVARQQRPPKQVGPRCGRRRQRRSPRGRAPGVQQEEQGPEEGGGEGKVLGGEHGAAGRELTTPSLMGHGKEVVVLQGLL